MRRPRPRLSHAASGGGSLLLTELGKLSLSLRSLATATPEIATVSEGDQLTWDRDVSRVLRSGRLSSRLLVLRGSDAQDVSVKEGSEQ